MEGRTSFPLKVFLYALGLGFAGVLLFRQTDLGINGFVWFVFACCTVLYLRPQSAKPIGKGSLAVLLAAGLFLLAMTWRDSEGLALLNALAVFSLVGIAVYKARNGAAYLGSLGSYLGGILSSWAWVFADWVMLAGNEIQWKSLANSDRSKNLGPIFRGLAIATPLVLVFGSLLASADDMFKSMLTPSLKLDGEQVLKDFWTFFGFGLLATWFLRRMLIAERVSIPPKVPGAAIIGFTEISIVLISLNVLFGAFVAVQFKYLFGGQDLIQLTPGLSYGEYARKGFFELVTVSALLLPTVLGLHSLLPKNGATTERRYRILTTTLIALLFVMMASAMKRMQIYVDAYGLSLLRIYVSAAMVWLALTFAWFLAAMFGKLYDRFAFGMVAAGVACIFALNVLNPDRLIVDVNLKHGQQKKLDALYLAELSGDATPALVAALPSLPKEEAAIIAYHLLERWEKARLDWRSWNVSESSAQEAVQSSLPKLKEFAKSYTPPEIPDDYWGY